MTVYDLNFYCHLLNQAPKHPRKNYFLLAQEHCALWSSPKDYLEVDEKVVMNLKNANTIHTNPDNSESAQPSPFNLSPLHTALTEEVTTPDGTPVFPEVVVPEAIMSAPIAWVAFRHMFKIT